MSEFEALVAAELLEADGVELVLAHRPDKGNLLQRWDGSWTNIYGQNVGQWKHIAPGDIKCTTAVICNADPGVHWERCPTVHPHGGCVQGEKVSVQTSQGCRVRHYAYLPRARYRTALGYPHAQDLSEHEQNLLNYFYNHTKDMMNHSYGKLKFDLTDSPNKNNTVTVDLGVNHPRPGMNADKDSTSGDVQEAQFHQAMKLSLEEHERKAATWLMTKTAIENQLLRASTATRQVHDDECWWDHRCFWHAVVHTIGEYMTSCWLSTTMPHTSSTALKPLCETRSWIT